MRPWSAIRQLVDRTDKTVVLVGIVGNAAHATHSGADLTNADLGVIHEFGLGVPERPWLRSTFASRREELKRLQAAACKAILAGRQTPAQALGLIGAFMAGAMKETIVRYGPFLFQPLALRTIAAKGSSAPLVDTGQFVNSISFVVVSA